MDEEKSLYFPVDENEKDVCFPVKEKKIIRIPLDEEEEEEFVPSPRSRVDMEVFEIWGCCRCLYNGRLLPEMLWWVFGTFPPYCLSIAFDYFIPIPVHLVVIYSLGNLFYQTLQAVVLLYPLLNHYWYPYKTTLRSMGPKGRFMIEFIPALTATALRLNLLNDEHDDKGLWHFHYGYLFLWLGCSGYLYVILHFMRRAYDITGKDVMLGLAMQSFCFIVNGELLVRAIALSFWFCISWYRYMTYSAPPALPTRPKMMESLPC